MVLFMKTLLTAIFRISIVCESEDELPSVMKVLFIISKESLTDRKRAVAAPLPEETLPKTKLFTRVWLLLVL